MLGQNSQQRSSRGQDLEGRKHSKIAKQLDTLMRDVKGLASNSEQQQQQKHQQTQQQQQQQQHYQQVTVCQQCGQNGHWTDICPGQSLALREEEAQAFYQNR